MWKSNPTEDLDFDVVEYLSVQAKKVSIEASREETSRIIRSYEKDADKLECIKTIFDDSSQAPEAQTLQNTKSFRILTDNKLHIWTTKPWDSHSQKSLKR